MADETKDVPGEPGAPRLSVVAPCLNEEENVDRLVQRVVDVFEQDGIPGELILVNDGSTDRTQEKIEAQEAAHPGVVRGVLHEVNRGICEGWNSGAEAARGEFVLTIDADMQYRPEDITTLYRAIEDGEHDLVQGWRETYKEESQLRRVLSRGLSGALNLAFFYWINDIKSGFVVYKREVFRHIMQDRNDFRLFQHFFIIKALANRYQFHQVPVVFDPRTAGESFITEPLRFSSRVVMDMPKAMFRYGLKERLSPQKREVS